MLQSPGRLIDLLFRDKIITEAQYKEVLGQTESGASAARFLLEKKYIAETKLLYFLSQKLSLPTFNLTKFEVNPSVQKMFTPDFIAQTGFLPLQIKNDHLVTAICDSDCLKNLALVTEKTEHKIEIVLTAFSMFDATFNKFFNANHRFAKIIESFKKEQEAEAQAQDTNSNLTTNPNSNPVYNLDEDTKNSSAIIQLVSKILTECIQRMASDIHVEPYEKKFRVRIRVDGSLHDLVQLPLAMKRSVISRFKILSQMDISETRIPQDGRIKLTLGSQEIDFRVNSMPTLFGEKIVLRMLNKGNLSLDLQKLGFEEAQLKKFRKGIYNPNGMVLVTGPTGSGKTTTLYSALAELNHITDNISTAEDPVEYNLEGINQVQVRKDVGLTFASVLRALLRQDPDIILVGEIRDLETAETAIQAALTGHLVLSTLHTNDAPSTITRLLNLGLDDFLVVSALNTIVAQRLLRKVCLECKQPAQENAAHLLKLGIPENIIQKASLFKGAGCEQCNKTGFKGRIAIYEVLDITENIKEMILKKATIVELRRAAIKEGMKTLRISAITKVIEGLTTLEEALTSTMEN